MCAKVAGFWDCGVRVRSAKELGIFFIRWSDMGRNLTRVSSQANSTS
jgi:hypothetical protein